MAASRVGKIAVCKNAEEYREYDSCSSIGIIYLEQDDGTLYYRSNILSKHRMRSFILPLEQGEETDRIIEWWYGGSSTT